MGLRAGVGSSEDDERSEMERVLRTMEVDGHTIDVVEMVDEDEAWLLLAVDEVVINDDAPLPTGADDDDVRDAVRLWAQRS